MGQEDQEAPAGAGVSRRRMLRGGLLAAGGAAALAPSPAPAATVSDGRRMPAPESGPAQDRSIRIDKAFRALIRRDAANPAKVETVRLLPFGGRQVLVRATANQCCYSLTGGLLQPNMPPSRYFSLPFLAGHAGLGVVEAIGPEVRSVRPGDKVFIGGTSQCNLCYNCVRGRSDACLANDLQAGPVAETLDGVPLAQTAGIGGMAEYVVSYEERLIPYVSDLPDEVIAMLPDACSTGLGMTCTLHPIESGSIVVVIGCGPIGLSAIQGARLQGAVRIIAVEPIAARRQMALKFGATEVIDPNTFEPGKLLAHLREITTSASRDRMFFGDRHPLLGGPDYVIEAVGHQHFPPKAEQARDPTGVEAMQLAVDLVARGGYGLFAGGYDGGDRISLNPNAMTISTKTYISCQNGGMQSRRDLPRFIKLIESGKFDAKSLISKVYPFEDVVRAFQDVADRTVISAVVKFG